MKLKTNINMNKKLFFAFVGLLLTLTSCKTSSYAGKVGQQLQTQVVLNQANFKCLGTFTGEAYAKKTQFNFKDNQGAMVKAKLNLLENARNAGVELTGSRVLINITTEVVEHDKKIMARMTAEIIEFVN